MRYYIKATIAIAALLLLSACQNSSNLEVNDLRCEMLESPLAIDSTAPHFSWKMVSLQRGESPTAYQILVATSPERLNEDDADLWNSGKVNDNSSLAIPYSGEKLRSRMIAYWTVRVWDSSGKASSWSEPALFGVGMLGEDDWSGEAQFIGAVQDEEYSQLAPLLRREFMYEPSEGRALLYVNSLGYHEAYLNGMAVSDALLAPAVSQFGKRSQIVAYDVTALLEEGVNDLVLWTGIGWYQTHSKDVVEGGPYVRAQLDILNSDGAHTIVATNGDWRYSDSGRHTFGKWLPHQMGGEIVDARITPRDLTSNTLKSLDWKPVVVADIPSHKATPQMCELNRAIRSFHPIAVNRDSDGWFVYDMGTNFVGFTDVKMPLVEAGKQIELHYDDFSPSDSVGFRNSLYTDYFIGDGGDGDHFCSKFNYKGYRYLKLVGLDMELPLSDITGSVVRTDYEANSSFACSDEDMNAIYGMVRNTLEALSLGGYIVDCPQIERLGYGGDGNASLITAQSYFNLAPLYLNWLQAWGDCQREDGGMPHTAPNPYSAGGGPYWCGFIIPAAWHTYINYADARLIERHYDSMRRWLAYAESYQKDGLLKQWPNTDYRNWYLGDWVPPMGVNPQDPSSIDIVNNSFLSDCYEMMSKMAELLGRSDDAHLYKSRHEEMNRVIHERFYDKERASYASGSQIDLLYPLLVDATPHGEVDRVKETLMKTTESRFNGHLAVGLVGISILTRWATENGESDFLYKMLKKRDYPGYLYMIDNGATLTWEEWNGHRSQLHNCYNGIGSWFMQALAGINPDEDNAGYRHVVIRPQLVDGITWVEATKDTPYGVVKSSYKIDGDGLVMDIIIPVGSSASLYLPKGYTPQNITPELEMNSDSIHLPSGSYTISCKINGAM